jgi:hypothetical protein
MEAAVGVDMGAQPVRKLRVMGGRLKTHSSCSDVQLGFHRRAVFGDSTNLWIRDIWSHLYAWILNFSQGR